MSGYFVLQVEWSSDDARKQYVERLGDMIRKHHGEYIVASRDYRVVEGKWRPGLLIVIKFPTMQDLSDWYDSEEYRSVLQFRLQNARCDAVITEGN
jgi:uncharacterized protein (DUF1330 family)